MKIAIRVSGILLLLFVPAVARGEVPACRMIEVEVVAVDASGAFHPVFNFGQALPAGTNWSTTQHGSEAELEVSVTWENEFDSAAPTVLLTICPTLEGSAEGTVKLEQLLWGSLYGPDPVLTVDKKPLVLPNVGSLVAVAAVSPVECVEPAG